MKMREVVVKGKAMGLKTGGKKKTDLIREIQTAEGNTACFQTGKESCDQTGCCWRDDCLQEKK